MGKRRTNRPRVKKRARHDPGRKNPYAAKEGTPTESEFQMILLQYCTEKSHLLVTPNTHVFGWESDLVSMTMAGYVHDYEIKRTRADFLRDREKDRYSILMSSESWTEADRRPNYFWYVAPYGVITEADLPPYAGLIVYTEGRKRHLVEVVKAPRLHTRKLSEKGRQYLERGMTSRYWRLRTSGDKRSKKRE